MKYIIILLCVLISIYKIECTTTVEVLNIPGDLQNNYYAEQINYCSTRAYYLLVKDDFDLENMTISYNQTNLGFTPQIFNKTEYIVLVSFPNVPIGNGYLNFTITNSVNESTVFDKVVQYSCELMPFPIQLEYLNGLDSVTMSKDDIYYCSITFNMTNLNPNFYQSIPSSNLKCSNVNCFSFSSQFRSTPGSLLTLFVQLLPPYLYPSNNFSLAITNPYNISEETQSSFLISQIKAENPDAIFRNFQCYPNNTIINSLTYFCFMDAINSTGLIFLVSDYDKMNTIKTQSVYGTPENKTVASFHLYRASGWKDATFFVAVQPGNTSAVSPMGNATVGTIPIYYPPNFEAYQQFPVVPFPSDSIAPTLNSVEYIPFGFQCEIIRINITDTGSGFQKYLPVGLTSTDISSGTINDGIFEAFVNYTEQTVLSLSLTPLTAYDFNGNSLNQDLFYYQNTDLQKTPLPLTFQRGYNSYVALNNFTSLYYEKNDITSSDEIQWNTIYFNLSYPNPNALVFYLPIYSYSDLLMANIYIGSWDPVALRYYVNFPMKGRSFRGPLSSFYLGVGNSLFLQTELTNLFPETSLRILTEYADEMPPIVTKWDTLDGLRTVSIPFNETVTLGFNLTIEDRINGFKNGRITISSKLDPGVTYYFSLNDSLPTSTKYKSHYSFSFQVNGKCKSDEYRISNMILTDKGDWSSNTTDTSINPLMNFLDVDYPIIQTLCTNQLNDNTPPQLIGVTANPNPLDVGGNNRTLTINILVSDQESGINIEKVPIISLFDIIGYNIITSPMKFLSKDPVTGNVTFQFQQDLPYAFGYPYGIFYKIEGILDYSFNYLSVNSNMIGSLPLANNVSVTFSGTPYIKSNSPISTMGGQLTIFGNSFQGNFIQGNSTVNIKYATTQQYQVVRNILVKHNVAMVFQVNAAIQPFKIQILNDIDNSIQSNEYIVTPYLLPTPVNPTTTPNSPGTNLCDPSKTCSNNGICTSTGCVCTNPWIGIYCNSRPIVIPSTPPANTTDPSYGNNINGTTPDGKEINLATLVSVISVRELDPIHNNKIIFEYIFNKWIYTNITDPTIPNSNPLYTYETNITKNNQNTSILITVEWFKDSEIVIFANQELKMNPSTMKYKIDIGKFNFQNSFNTLQIVMKSSIISSNIEQSCSSKQFGQTSDTNFEYSKLQVDNYSLYSKFLKLGIVDNRIIKVTNIPLDSTNNPVSTATQTETFIGITLPNFKQFAILDPDFSVLLDSTPAEDEDNSICTSTPKKSLTKSQLAGIIIGSSLFVIAAITVVSYFLYKRRQYTIMQQKIAAINKRS